MCARPQIDESAPAYNLTVLGRNVEVTDPMKEYAREKVSKIERLHGRVLEVIVTMDIIKLEHRVDIVMKVDHTKIAVHSSTENMYASVDLATEKLQRQLRRYRKRIQEHHARGLSTVDLNVNVIERPGVDELEDINDAIEDETLAQAEALYGPHSISKQKSLQLKTLNVDEAIMKMDLSGDNFLLFRNEEDQKLNLMYRRRDASYGLIEPE